jgi:hypothetical protein
MRLLIVLGVLAVATRGVAGTADYYENARFGFSIDVPDAVAGDKTESDNSDGATFHSGDGKAELRVWGSNILDGGFAEAVEQDTKFSEDDGWTISYRKRSGKLWAAYSGSRQGRVFYERVIPACRGGATARYRLEYPQASRHAWDAAIRILNASLRARGRCL